jgi:hypothetical protein
VKRLAAGLRREPVRVYLYGLLFPGAALAVAYGVLSNDKAALWLTLGAAVLVPGAAELARRKVTPVDDPHTKAGQPAELVPETPADGWR